MTMPATGGGPSFRDRLSGILPSWTSLVALLFQAIALVALLTIVVIVSHHFGVLPLAPNTGNGIVKASSTVPQQTEEYFLGGLKDDPPTDPTDEWWLARSDHRLIANAVFNCKELQFTSAYMPRQYFSALLLDLDLRGDHIFRSKIAVDSELLARENGAPQLALTSSDQDLLSLSDAIARSRLAAAEGAKTNFPWAQRLGLTTLIVAALATLFVTLQGRMKPIELPEEDQNRIASQGIGARIRHSLIGPGCGFRWVAFMAITLSITGTSLTGLRQVYDPTRTLTQNTRALLELRQLHQEIMLGVKCEEGKKRIEAHRRSADWANAIRRIRANIIPDFGAFANLDFGGTALRSDTAQNQPPDNGRSATPREAAPTDAATPISAPAGPAALPAATPATAPAAPPNNP